MRLVFGKQRLPFLLLTSLVLGMSLATLAVVGDRPGVPRSLTLMANLATPWGLAAFVVGRRALSARDGALAGGVALLIGMVAFYVLTPAIYLHGLRDVVWTAVALVVGPVMGMCGAFSVREKEDRPVVTAVLPSAVVLGEAIWTTIDRRPWQWNFILEPHRWHDLGVLVLLALIALALPAVIRTQTGLIRTYLSVVIGSLMGAVGVAGLYWILIRV